MKIKVCGLKYLHNISALLSLSPDFIGLIFYPPSPRYVGRQPRLAAYMRQIRHVQKVGVFMNACPEAVLQVAADYALDMVQLHGDESPEVCGAIRNVIPVIKSFSVHPGFDFGGLDAYRSTCDYYLFDTASPGYGGSGQTFDWSLLEEQHIPVPFFLAGGLSSGNYQAALKMNHPMLAGLDINSRFEVWPGYKDVNTIKSFIHAIRIR